MKIGSAARVEIPRSFDRVNRVLRFMDNYLPRVDVQIAGLNAVINFTRNADAKTCTLTETDVFDVVAKTLTRHVEEIPIVWRCAMALATLASYSSDIAIDIGMTNIHETLIDHFIEFSAHPLAQQQILWLLAALASWPRSYKLLHKSRKCLEFIKNVIEVSEEREKQSVIMMMEGQGNAAQVSVADIEAMRFHGNSSYCRIWMMTLYRTFPF